MRRLFQENFRRFSSEEKLDPLLIMPRYFTAFLVERIIESLATHATNCMAGVRLLVEVLGVLGGIVAPGQPVLRSVPLEVRMV
jgi:hypothetical protein